MKRQPAPPPTPAYHEGTAAFDAGQPEDACPYPSGVDDPTSSKRIQWFNGWFTRRTGVRLAEVFRRNRIPWP